MTPINDSDQRNLMLTDIRDGVKSIRNEMSTVLQVQAAMAVTLATHDKRIEGLEKLKDNIVNLLMKWALGITLLSGTVNWLTNYLTTKH